MKKAFIFRLPDELLDDIISRAAYLPENTPSMRSFGYEHSELYGTLTALCLSCRRLNRLAKPHLYADPVIYCYMPRRSKKTTELIHRSCRENQFLWPLCKRLIIHYKDGDNADDREHRRNPCLYVAMDSVTWFTAVKSLVIFGVGTDERGWILLRSALENIKGLNLLSLGNQEQYNLRIPQVVEIFSIFKLEGIRTLHLEGISMCRGDTQSWRPLQENAGTARFTALELRSFLQTPNVLRDLVRWPAHLEKFTLEHTYGSCYSVLGLFTDWSLAILQPILAIHKSTLRSISIRCINMFGLDGFDLRDFENLEELRLSYQTTNGTTDIHLIPNLLAPRLRVFHWDLTLEDQQCNETLSFFQQKEEDWLRTLALAAISQWCPLRRIEIKFTPLYTYYFDGVYPWDRMDALGRELRPHGIQVGYNPPSASREEYMDILNRSMARKEKLETTDFW